jgi:hypothetical protein
MPNPPPEKLSKPPAQWPTLLGQYQPVLGWAQPAAVVGPVLQLGAGAVEVQDLQEVRLKGSEVAGDLKVESRG